MKTKLLLLAALAGGLSIPAVSAHAQATGKVVSTCGAQSYPVGSPQYPTMDTTGSSCFTGTATVSPTGVTTTVTPGTVTTHLTFQSALAAGGSRKGCTIVNTSNDVEYVYFGATGSATTAGSIPLTPNQAVFCAVGGIEVATDNIAITSATTDGATFVVNSQ